MRSFLNVLRGSTLEWTGGLKSFFAIQTNQNENSAHSSSRSFHSRRLFQLISLVLLFGCEDRASSLTSDLLDRPSTVNMTLSDFNLSSPRSFRDGMYHLRVEVNSALLDGLRAECRFSNQTVLASIEDSMIGCPLEFTQQEDGVHAIDLVVTRGAGALYVLELNVTKDTTPPEVRLKEQADYRPNEEIVVRVTDKMSDVVEVVYRINGSPSQLRAANRGDDFFLTLPDSLTTGYHQANIKAIDSLGNERNEVFSFLMLRDQPSLIQMNNKLTKEPVYTLAAVIDSGSYEGDYTGVCRLGQQEVTAFIEGENLICRLDIAHLADGPYEVRILLTANYDRTYSFDLSFIKDTGTPVIDLSSLASYDRHSSQILITIEDASNVTATYSLADGVVRSLSKDGNSYVVDLPDSLGTGRHTIEVHAVDTLGNEATKSGSFVLLRDTPTLDITSAPTTNDGIYRLAATIDSGGYEGGYSGVCRLGSQQVVASIDSDSLSCNLVLAKLADGNHPIEVSLRAAYQADGEAYDYTFALLKDTTGPTIDLSSLAPSYDSLGKVISVGISDALSEVAAARYRFDDSAPQSLLKQGESYPVALESLGTGRHTIEIWAEDSLGNEATERASFVLLRDSPTLNLTSANVTNRAIYRLEATIDSGSYKGGYSGVCLLGNQRVVANIDLSSLSCDLAFVKLADGNHPIEVSLRAAYQADGENYDYTFDLLKDTTGPTIDLSSLAASYDNLEEVISVDISDALSEVAAARYQFDDGAPQSLLKRGESYSFNLLESLGTGRHTIEIWTVDSLGNEATERASFVLLRDSPTLNLTSANVTNRAIYNLAATIDSGSYEGGYSGVCLLGTQRVMASIGVDSLSCDLVLSGLPDGSYMIEVLLTATEYAKKYSFSIPLIKDTAPPTISLPDLQGVYGQGDVNIMVVLLDSFSAIKNASYRLNGGAFEPLLKGEEGYVLSLTLPTDSYSILIRAEDQVGNVGTRELSLIVVQEVPQLSQTSPAITVNRTYTLTAALDPGSYTGGFTATCKLEGGIASAGEVVDNRLSCPLRLDTDGLYRANVILTAVNLNRAYSYTFNLVRDTTPPSVDLSSVAREYHGSESVERLTIMDSHSDVAIANWRIGQLAAGVLMRVDMSDEWSFTMPVALLPTGAHRVDFNISDSLGNNQLYGHDFLVLKDRPTVQLAGSGRTNLNNYNLIMRLDAGSYLGGYSGDCSLGGERFQLDFSAIVSPINAQQINCTLDLTGLADGEHRVAINLTADYDRSYTSSLPFIKDTTAPLISFTQFESRYEMPSGPIIMAMTIEDEWSAVSQVTYQLNDAAATSLTEGHQGHYEFSLPPSIATGQHRVVIRVADELGNERIEERLFAILRDAPHLSQTSPTTTVNRTYTLTAALNPGSYQGGFTATCKLEGGIASVGEVVDDRLSCPLRLDTDGLYKANVTLTAVSLAEAYSYIFNIVRDTRPPSVDLTSVAREYQGSESVQRLTITDSHSDVAIANWRIGQLAAGVLTRVGMTDEWSFTMPVALLPTGAHRIDFNISDSLGNNQLYGHDFLVLKDRPTVQLAGSDRTNLNNYNLMARLDTGSYLGGYSGDCSLGGERFQLDFSAINTQQINCTLDLAGLADGEHRVDVNLTADYDRSYILSLHLIKDTAAPLITFTQFESRYEMPSGPIIMATTIEDEWSAISQVTYQLDDAVAISLTEQAGRQGRYEFSLPPSITTGQHRVMIRVADELGNERVEERSFVVLRDAPQLMLTTALASSNASHNFAATINAGSYLGGYTGICDLYGDLQNASIQNNLLSCELNLVGLTDGRYPLAVVLTADYDISYEHNFVFTIDRTAPSIQLLNLQESYGEDFGGQAVEAVIRDSLSNVSHVDYQLDDGAIKLLTEIDGRYSFTLPPFLSTGRHWLTLTATDTLGHQNVIRRSFLILRDAPQLSRTSPAITTTHYYNFTATIDSASYTGDYSGQCSAGGQAPVEARIDSHQLNCELDLWSLENGVLSIEVNLTTDYDRSYDFVLRLLKDVDVDRDDDGLIEIANAAELDAIRYQLDASGKRTAEDMRLNRVGCPIGGCRGYELIGDINLTDIPNWRPIGQNKSVGETPLDDSCQDEVEPFSGIFEGNGNRISGLRIDRPTEDCVGLFSSISQGEVRNLNLETVAIRGAEQVGSLAGGITSTLITGVAVFIHHNVSGLERIGGLVGRAVGSKILSSYVTVDTVKGGRTVGGLAGRIEWSDIYYSYVLSNMVKADNIYGLPWVRLGGFSTVGGLVGYSKFSTFLASYAKAHNLQGAIQIGGLVGYFRDSKLIHSTAAIAEIKGGTGLGGLIGTVAEFSYVSNSYAVTKKITAASEFFGPLIGGRDAPLLHRLVHRLTHSYWDRTAVNISRDESLMESLRIPSFPVFWYENTPRAHRNYYDETAQRSLALKSPIDYSGLYGLWDKAIDIDDADWDDDLATGVDPITRWCDTNMDGSIDATERRLDNRIWNFGSNKDYPMLRCPPEPPAWVKQRFPRLFEDSDNDSIVDYLDQFAGTQCSEMADCDGDGVTDALDVFPVDASESGDEDNDGVGNNADIDDDGDGLIEIATAAELNMVRYQLNGIGKRMSHQAPLDQTGCGDGEDTSICIGYELVADISLASYDQGFSWQPLGHDTVPTASGCQGEGLGSVFEGNGNKISGLVINRPHEDCVGLFGKLGSLARIRNLHLEVDSITGDEYVGGMVAYGYGAKISSSSVVFNNIKGDRGVGGFIGYASNMRLTGLTVTGRNLNGSSSNVGGLVGGDGNSAIRFSSARVDSIRGATDVGGLVGEGIRTEVISSFSFARLIDGNGKIGGLIGYGSDASVITSYAISDSITADTWISTSGGGVQSSSSAAGGLMGWAVRTNVVYSYAVARSISGNGDHVSGLIGDGDGQNSLILYSYAVSGLLRQSDTEPLANGLVKGGSATIIRSYWDSTVSGIASLVGTAAQSTSQLQSPTDYSGIYQYWDDIINDGFSLWCDLNHNGELDVDERRQDNLIWDFGTAVQYPAIRCTPDATVLQRSGWQLTNGKPVINDHIFHLDLDTDRDGVEDGRDLFPTDPTESSDRDGDGIGDNKDNCPSIANVDQEDMDGDGYGDACDIDIDGDGYADLGDNCPLDFNPSQRDLDGDDYADACDIDEDGDGLIEIATAAQLDAIRYQLDGTGRRYMEGGVLETGGCGDGRHLSSCSGYELINDINLTDYITATEGWEPIGNDTNMAEEGCQGDGFSSVLDGNGQTISGLRILRPTEDCVGLFGYIDGGEVRNLKVEATRIAGKSKVGILAGHAGRTKILTTSVSSFTLTGEGDHIGGLVGHLSTGEIISTSAVVNGMIIGDSQVGGLIGRNFLSTIRSSSALSNHIGERGRGIQVGGLIGYSWDMRISHSRAFFNTLNGQSQLGGLIGRCAHSDDLAQTIVASMARFSLISGNNEIGGLIGSCNKVQIVSSMVSGVDLVGVDSIGGLMGRANDITLASSYAAVSNIEGSSNTNGLVGSGDSLTIDDSYWAFLTNGLSADAFAKSLLDLQSSIEFSGIYASWDEGVDLNRNGSIEDTTRWCDINHDGVIDPYERRESNLIWDLGRSNEYPVLRCLPEISSKQKKALPELFGDTDGDGIADAFDVGVFNVGVFNRRLCWMFADCDLDGVDDGQDVFPTNPNEQLDSDGDTIGDNADNCLFVFNPTQLDSDGDNKGDICDADSDNDGVGDGGDNCLLVYNPTQENSDSDIYGDACDIDSDGDGLIEITTAAELNAVRYQLDANGRRLTRNGLLTTLGCGDGNAVLYCDGYELAADIDLAAYADRDEGKGWQPIGYDDDGTTDGCQGSDFGSIFEGNDFAIHNLHIERPNEDCIGLFGFTSGEFRNLTLQNANVSGNERVGILAGEADGASITDITIDSSRVHGTNKYVGGLVGKLAAATVEAVFVAANVSGQSHVGGVVGRSDESSLSYASFTGDEVSIVNGFLSLGYIGGLVGWAEETTIMHSIVLGTRVTGIGRIGGAVGILRQGSMIGSAALTSRVINRGASLVRSLVMGGLIGEAWKADIAVSAAFSRKLLRDSGMINLRGSVIGGLVGGSRYLRLFSSLAVTGQITRVTFVGGLLGYNRDTVVRDNSYWYSRAGLTSDAEMITTSELQLPTRNTGIYNNWGSGIDFDNEDGNDLLYLGVDDNTRWCDTNRNGQIDRNERTSSNLIWDFGTSREYPVVSCAPISPQQQREFIRGL